MLMIINFAVTSFTWGVWVWEGEIHLQTFSASLDSSYVIVLVFKACIRTKQGKNGYNSALQ